MELELIRLAEWRMRRGYSQAELSGLSGVERTTISKLETVSRKAQPVTARRLAGALGVTVEDLAEGRPGSVGGRASGHAGGRTGEHGADRSAERRIGPDERAAAERALALYHEGLASASEVSDAMRLLRSALADLDAAALEIESLRERAPGTASGKAPGGREK